MRKIPTAWWAARVTGCALLGALAALQAAADEKEPASTLGGALRDGKFTLGLRYRYEFVDQDGIDDRAHASTLRTAVGYDSRPFHGFSAGFEVEDVTAIGNDRLYNNAGAPGLGNGVTDRPTVADPEITEFNQVHLAFEGPRGTRIRGGRIEYVLDNQRFIGNVGWRQNHQSFDAATLASDALENWHFAYAYLDRQHTVSGADNPMASHLVHVAFDSRLGKAAAYGYLLDFESAALHGNSSSTYGLRLDGTAGVSRFTVLYLGEYARQSDHADNPRQFGLDYVHAVLGAKWSSWALRGGYEMLRGDGTSAFQMPLGTNHQFNGFADKFLTTPSDGLRDFYGRLSWDWKTASVFVDYHVFEADEGNESYGDELDFQALYSTPWKQQFAAKAAVYKAERFATDTTKLMLWTAWGF